MSYFIILFFFSLQTLNLLLCTGKQCLQNSAPREPAENSGMSMDDCNTLREALCGAAQGFNQACGIWLFVADTAEEMMSKQTTKDE